MAASPSAKRPAPKRSAAAKPAAKNGAAKSPAKAKTEPVAEPATMEAPIDRRGKDRRDPQAAAAAPLPERRKKVNRRRQIDPTTCERDYSDDEVQFMNALDEYKRSSGRMFPTCSEVLEVVRGLGYVKLSPTEAAAARATGEVEPQNLQREDEE